MVDSTNIEQYGTVSHKGFDHKDTEIQYIERNLSSQASPVLENGWAKAYETKDAEFVMEITARNIVLVSKDSGTPKFGKADIYVDEGDSTSDGADTYVESGDDYGRSACEWMGSLQSADYFE
mgnify:CR=1 FL=1